MGSVRILLAFSLITLLLGSAGCQKLKARSQANENDPLPDKSVEAPGEVPKKAVAGASEVALGLALSPDGKLLVLLGKENRLSVWSVPESKRLLTLPGDPESPVRAVAVSPDGKELAFSSGSDIKLVSLPDGKPLHTFTGHESGVCCLAITPDGRLLISGGRDNFIRLWSLPQRKHLKTLPNLYSTVNALAITPDSKLLVSGSGFLKGEVKLWSLPDGEAIKNLPGHERAVHTLAVAADGKVLAVVSAGKVRLWSLPEGKELHAGIDSGTVNALALSPDGKLLAVANEQTIRLWTVPEGKPARTLTQSRTPVTALAFLQDGPDNLVAIDSQGAVRFWNPITGDSRPLQAR